MVEVYRNDGKKIFAEDIDWVHSDDYRNLEIHLKKTVCEKLSDEEMFTLMQLINKRIEYGVHVEEAKDLIHLLDKLEKIHERKYSK